LQPCCVRCRPLNCEAGMRKALLQTVSLIYSPLLSERQSSGGERGSSAGWTARLSRGRWRMRLELMIWARAV
jgi:hypothetical protein